jgi:hypothetical protein
MPLAADASGPRRRAAVREARIPCAAIHDAVCAGEQVGSEAKNALYAGMKPMLEAR